jgi:membrane protease YdiL (CAAX protease family)
MKFLDLAKLGRTSIGLYIGGIAVLVLFFILGGLPLLFDANHRLPGLELDLENPAFIEAYGSTRLLVGELLSFFLAFVGFVLYLRYVHKRPLTSIFTAAPRFRWKRFFGVGGALFFIVCLFTYLEVLWSGQPASVQWNFKAPIFWPLFLFSMLLIPFQAAIEELVFRVYALQGLYLRTKSVWLSIALSSAMFAFMHISNPEISVLGPGLLLYYFMAGLFLALLSVQDDGLELALAFHIFNNLFGAFVVSSDWHAFHTEALFIDHRGPGSLFFQLVSGLLVFTGLYFVLSKIFNWKPLRTLR